MDMLEFSAVFSNIYSFIDDFGSEWTDWWNLTAGYRDIVHFALLHGIDRMKSCKVIDMDID